MVVTALQGLAPPDFAGRVGRKPEILLLPHPNPLFQLPEI